VSAEVAALPVPAAETLRLINRGGPTASASGEVAATPDSAATLPSASTGHVPARRAAFNIQIQAAMDQKNASQIVGQLQQLGYHPHLVSTSIGGHTWYRVEIGPYASQNEAAAVKAELRLKYNSTFDPPAPILGDDSPDLLLPFSPTPLRIGLSTELFGN
jgi:cell division septation protein DedD